MKLETLIEELEDATPSTDTIKFTVSKAKGLITVIAAHHFPKIISCDTAYKNTKIDFDEVKDLFLSLEKKYNNLYKKTNLIDEKTAKHYDALYNALIEDSVKKAWRGDDYTLVSSITFKYPAKE